jgi:hypothetical protein
MPDRDFEMQELSLADRHVHQAEQIILDQRLEIARLRLKGYDTGLAEQALKVFNHTFQIMCLHRDNIAKTIQKIDRGLI